MFCCGVRRRRQRKKYGTEHAQALHVVYVDSNGQAAGAAEEKEQKNGTGKRIKKAEEDHGKNKHGEKDRLENGGYEPDSKEKVNKLAANYVSQLTSLLQLTVEKKNRKNHSKQPLIV